MNNRYFIYIYLYDSDFGKNNFFEKLFLNENNAHDMSWKNGPLTPSPGTILGSEAGVFSVVRWGGAYMLFEGFGESENVVVAHSVGNILYGVAGG